MTKAHARSTDPATSHAAAASMQRSLSRLESMVYEAISRSGERGATSLELAELLNTPRVTVSPRIAPLVRKHLVRDSGQKRCGHSRREAIVWVVH